MAKVRVLGVRTNLHQYAMKVLVPDEKKGTGEINQSINKRIAYAVKYTIGLCKRHQALIKPPKANPKLTAFKMYRFFLDPGNIGMMATFFMARIFPVLRKYAHLKTPMRLYIITYLHTHNFASKEEMTKALYTMKLKLTGLKIFFELTNLIKNGMISKHSQTINGKEKAMYKLTAEGKIAVEGFLNKSIVYDCMQYAATKRLVNMSRSQRDKKLKRRHWKKTA